MKKLYICGLQGGGKSLLRQLLDGHPQIFSPGLIISPGLSLLSDNFLNVFLPKRANYRASDQDYFYRCFSDAELEIVHNQQSWLLTVGDLWTFLFRHEDFNVPIDVRYADWNKLARESDSISSTVVDFEFNKFFEQTTNRILSVRKFTTIEKLQNLIYRSCIESYRTYPWEYSENSYFLQLSGANGIPSIQSICKHNAEKKILVIRRGYLSSALMNAERLSERFPQYKNVDNKLKAIVFGTPFENALYSRKYRTKYKKFYRQLELEENNTEDIFEVNFDEMILNTSQTMDQVAKFLGLPTNPILYSATINGIRVSHHTGVLDVGEIRHDPNHLLSQKQRDTVECMFMGWNKNVGMRRNFLSLLEVWKFRILGTYGIKIARKLFKKMFSTTNLRPIK